MAVEEILTMSYPRRVVETVINGLQDPLNLHLIKLAGFEFPPELQRHFREECEEWLDRIQRMRMKPSGRPGSFKFFYDLLYDYPFGGAELENMTSIMDLIRRRYPSVNQKRSPEQMVGWLREFHTRVADRITNRQTVLDLIPV